MKGEYDNFRDGSNLYGYYIWKGHNNMCIESWPILSADQWLVSHKMIQLSESFMNGHSWTV